MLKPNSTLLLALWFLPACFPDKLTGEDLLADTSTDASSDEVGSSETTTSETTTSDSTSETTTSETTTSDSTSDSTSEGCEPMISGVFLLAIETSLGPELPLQFVLTLDAASSDCMMVVASFTLQPLSLDVGSTTTPREVIGEPLIFESVEFDAMGNFVLDLGEVMISGAANPVTGSDITATLVLDGHVVHVDALCGTVTGMLTSPLEVDLGGTTFAAIRLVDEGTNPDTLPNTFPTNCGQVPPP